MLVRKQLLNNDTGVRVQNVNIACTEAVAPEPGKPVGRSTRRNVARDPHFAMRAVARVLQARLHPIKRSLARRAVACRVTCIVREQVGGQDQQRDGCPLQLNLVVAVLQERAIAARGQRQLMLPHLCERGQQRRRLSSIVRVHIIVANHAEDRGRVGGQRRTDRAAHVGNDLQHHGVGLVVALVLRRHPALYLVHRVVAEQQHKAHVLTQLRGCLSSPLHQQQRHIAPHLTQIPVQRARGRAFRGICSEVVAQARSAQAAAVERIQVDVIEHQDVAVCR